MKNYNKILEAINRGIQLALDDFDDEEQVQNIRSKQVQNRDYTKEYLDLMEEVVDLGLPSGTLWCKYNLGVDSNKLKTAKQWYGDYYAWAEIESKLRFNWDNYKYGKDYNKLTKYCTNSIKGLYGFTDNLTELLPEDDVAYQNKKLYNFKFRIPTKEQCEELLKYTNIYWVNNYDPNKIEHNPKDDEGIQGLNGRIFEGRNGNIIFVPAAGYRFGCEIKYVSFDGSLWSSSLCVGYSDSAYILGFDQQEIIITDDYYRYGGRTIRPVINL